MSLLREEQQGGEEGAGLQASVLEAKDVPAVAAMLARSFEVDAGYRFLFPDPPTREAGLADFFGRNLRIHLPHRCTRVARDASGPVATVTVRPPGGVHVSMATMLRHGLLPLALARGLSTVRRLLWLKETYDALEGELGGGRPYWHVHMMAVREDRQGSGLGSRVLGAALAECDARDASLPVVLTTHLEKNVVFYQRAGFDVTSERTMHPPSSTPYTVWSMRREPRA